MNIFLLAQEKSLPAIHFQQDTEPKSDKNTVETHVAEESSPEEYHVPIETASFNGITPGSSSVAQLHKDFGTPANTLKDGAGKGIDVEEYKLEGFKAVAFHTMKGTVLAVIAEMEESVDARNLASELGIEHVQSVFITDEKGTIKGEIFPEIGVAFAYDPSKPLGNVADMAKEPMSVPMNALQILFQPVGPEPFLLRAETWVDVDPKRAYRDIELALELDPENANAKAYKKILLEALPNLEKGEGTTQKSVTKEENLSEKKEQKNEDAREKKVALTELEPPSLDTLTDDTFDNTANNETDSETDSETDNETDNETGRVTSESTETNTPEVSVDKTLVESETDVKNEEDNGFEPVDGVMAETERTMSELPTELPLEIPKELPQSITLPEVDKLPEMPEDVGLSGILPDEMAGVSEFQGKNEADLPNDDTTLELPTELANELDTLEETVSEPVDEVAERVVEIPYVAEITFEDELFERVEELARNQRFEVALDLLEEIRKKYLDNPFVSFRANLIDGDIQMILPTPNVEQAFLRHRRAAEQGEKLLEVGKVLNGRMQPLTEAERLMVQKLLVDVWLGIAGDLATGKWDKNVENCQKWLQKVQKQIDLLAPATVTNPTADAVAFRYRTIYRMLSIALLLGQEVDLTNYTNQLIFATQEQLKKVENRQQYFDICIETAVLLDNVGAICIRRNEDVVAQRYLIRAVTMMERVRDNKEELTSREMFLLSQLYYHTGQVFAWSAQHLTDEKTKKLIKKAEEVNQRKNELHIQAIEWYKKSIPYLMKIIRTREWLDLVQLSQIANGMSISYMETGDTKNALVLLKTGIFCLEQHVMKNPKDKFLLTIPYRNIIRVLEYQRNLEEMEKYKKKLDALAI